MMSSIKAATSGLTNPFIFPVKILNKKATPEAVLSRDGKLHEKIAGNGTITHPAIRNDGVGKSFHKNGSQMLRRY
jgi:hypothetical protein